MSRLGELIRTLCPNGVEYKRLGEILYRTSTGLNPRSNFRLNTEDAKNMYVTVKEITKGKIVFSEKTDKINDEAVRIIQNRSNLEEGDVLLSGIGTIGKVALVDIPTDNWNCSESVFILKPRHDIINAKFLKYVLEADYVQNYFDKTASGSTLRGIRQKDLVALEIPVPPMEVQEEIVRLLDEFTQLEAELEAELEARKKQYEHYRDTLLDFTPPADENVTWMTMSELCELRNGYTPSKAVGEYWEGGTIPWFRMEDIRQNGRILSDSIQHITPEAVKGGKLFSANSFILATTATIGEHALLIADSLANQQFTNLKIRESLANLVDVKYFYYYLFIIDEWCKNNINISGFASVDMTKFKNVQIPIPPIEEQERIVGILDKFEALCTDLCEGLPAEIEARRRQYEHYRDRLLRFKRLSA